jgi:hypothetical protein
VTGIKSRFFVPRVVQGYEWVTADVEEDYGQIHGLDGQERSADWSPVAVSLLHETEDGEPRRPALMPWLNDAVLVIRDGAIDKLSPILQPYGELLPLSCTEADLAVFNATRLIPALDENRSEILRFGSGGIMAVPRLVLRETAEHGEMFKLAEIKSSPLLLSERLVEQIRQAVELDGTDFVEATEL